MENIKKFTGKAELYTKYRPGYSKDFVDFLFEKVGFSANSIVVDVGCGTGQFSKMLAEKDSTVFGVEPNKDMSEQASSFMQDFKKFHVVQACAEQTTLENNFADFVTSAQSFHFFDTIKFKRECKRILKIGGKVVLIWNSRSADNEIVMQHAKICKKFCPNFNGFGGDLNKIEKPVQDFFENKCQKVSFENDLKFSLDSFVGRVLSSSYSISKADANFIFFVGELEQLFFKFAVDNELTIPNQTVAFFGEIE